MEDIINYNVIVRNLTEWTAGNPSFTMDQGTITDGIGNNTISFSARNEFAVLNTRANNIQGCCFAVGATAELNDSVGKGLAGISGAAPAGVLATGTTPWYNASGVGPTNIPLVTVTRRYQVQLALGLMTQEKLIPTKYMASQLAIELTLETVANCVVADYLQSAGAPGFGYTPGLASQINYAVHNVNLIPEILEFDACKF